MENILKEKQNRVGLAMVDTHGTESNRSIYDNTENLIREALLQGGLGKVNKQAPLADIIEPGMCVLLKPNWVHHFNMGNGGIECMLTHPNFILGVLKEVISARPGKIILGDAPIQGCEWDKLFSSEFRENLDKLGQFCKIELIDFRRTILHRGDLVSGVQTDVREDSKYVLFELGTDSLLEAVSFPPGRFRVTNYDPRQLNITHKPGIHKYLLCRELFEADVILNLPKLKTHRKTGFTGALKNLVGFNGSKEYLPHHRIGGTGLGGDCYPGYAPLKRLAEFCLDCGNRNIGTPINKFWYSLAYRMLNFRSHYGNSEIEGSWYGNDTVWRMVLDLNRIAIYGLPDGTMADVPQRKIWSITDAIMCGEGEGPLAPTPFVLGAVTFSDSTLTADLLHSALLRLESEKIPFLRHATEQFRWPLLYDMRSIDVRYKNRSISLSQIAEELGKDIRLSQGWIDRCELSRESNNRYLSS